MVVLEDVGMCIVQCGEIRCPLCSKRCVWWKAGYHLRIRCLLRCCQVTLKMMNRWWRGLIECRSCRHERRRVDHGSGVRVRHHDTWMHLQAKESVVEWTNETEWEGERMYPVWLSIVVLLVIDLVRMWHRMHARGILVGCLHDGWVRGDGAGSGSIPLVHRSWIGLARRTYVSRCLRTKISG